MWWEASKPQLLFAPLAEFTDAPMRRVTAEFGATWTHTEMVNARALADGGHPSLRLLASLPEGELVPCSAQLYGADPNDFGRAAERIEALGLYSAIDLNIGCPMPRIRACGAGSALLDKPELVRRLVAAVREHSSLPVTVKTRLGPIPGNVTAPDILRAARDGGAAACTIHARYTSQILSGPIDVATLAEVISLGIMPVAANGAVRSSADALALWRNSGAQSVMVGWGVIGNPWLVRAIAKTLQTGTVVERETPAWPEVKALLFRHMELSRVYHERQRDLYPEANDTITVEERVALDFRTQFFRYLKGFPGSNRFRAHLVELKTEKAIREALEAFA